MPINQQPTRADTTLKAYRTEAARHLRRARRDHPSLGPLAALVTSVEEGDRLKASSTRRYKQELAVAVEMLVETGQANRAEAAAAEKRIEGALKARRGKRLTPKTSARKVRDASPDEVAAVLAVLQERAARSATPGRAGTPGDDLARLLLALVTVSPLLGLRPTEWNGARLEGTSLVVPCAKATNGRSIALERRQGLSSYATPVLAAVSAVVTLMPPVLDAHDGSWKRVLKALAERLARACRTAGTRRLCLYAFRHVAIATWKAHGLPPGVIAALAGHKSTRTAQAWYAGARHGWTAESLPEADPALVALVEARADARPADELRDGVVLLTDESADTSGENVAADTVQEPDPSRGLALVGAEAAQDLHDPFAGELVAFPNPRAPSPGPRPEAHAAAQRFRQIADAWAAELASILARMRANGRRRPAWDGALWPDLDQAAEVLVAHEAVLGGEPDTPAPGLR
jgi:integrase